MREEINSIKNQMLIDKNETNKQFQILQKMLTDIQYSIIKGGSIKNLEREAAIVKLPVGSAKDLYQLNIDCTDKKVLEQLVIFFYYFN